MLWIASLPPDSTCYIVCDQVSAQRAKEIKNLACCLCTPCQSQKSGSQLCQCCFSASLFQFCCTADDTAAGWQSASMCSERWCPLDVCARCGRADTFTTLMDVVVPIVQLLGSHNDLLIANVGLHHDPKYKESAQASQLIPYCPSAY